MTQNKIKETISIILNDTGAYKQILEYLETLHVSNVDRWVELTEEAMVNEVVEQIEETDLLENTTMLPQEVQDLLTEHLGEHFDEPNDLLDLDNKLNKLGYTIQWDMDNTVYDLQIKLN